MSKKQEIVRKLAESGRFECSITEKGIVFENTAICDTGCKILGYPREFGHKEFKDEDEVISYYKNIIKESLSSKDGTFREGNAYCSLSNLDEVINIIKKEE